MIKEEFLFPQFYVNKIPICDNCKSRLKDTGMMYMSNPPILEYKCENCEKFYTFKESDLKGEWKWRVI